MSLDPERRPVAAEQLDALETDLRALRGVLYGLLELLAWAVLAVPAGLLLLVLRRQEGFLWSAVFEVSRAVMVGVAAVAALRLSRRFFEPFVRVAWVHYVVGAVFAGAAGLGLAFLEAFRGNPGSLKDLARDIAMALAGLAWIASFDRKLPVIRGPASRWALRVFVVVLVGRVAYPLVRIEWRTGERKASFPTLAAFESSDEEVFVFPGHGATLERVSPPPGFKLARGERVGKVTFPRGESPKLEVSGLVGDWSTASTLAFDVYSAASASVELHVRLDDLPHRGESSHRYDTTVPIPPGESTQRISVDDIRGGVGGHDMNLDRMNAMLLYMWEPKQTTVLYLDTIRLERSASNTAETAERTEAHAAEFSTAGIAAAEPPPAFASLMTGHARHPPPNVPAPALYASFTDPVFGTHVRRVTEPSQWPGATRIRHYYAKANPWNADGTRAILISDSGTTLLYDTTSWKPIRALRIASSDAEIQWHPTDPDILYHLDFINHSSDVRAMFRYDVRTDEKVLMHDFSEYETARGNLEGNLDRTGRYYAMFGSKGKDATEAFVYDLKKDTISSRITVTATMAGDWISVTPSGKYVVMMGGDRSRVYDINMKHLRDLPNGSYGHGDLCTAADGRDVMVYDGADEQLDENRNLNIADLGSGEVRIGTRLGWQTTPHVSCRNIDLLGWALISTQGPDQRYPNHDFEIFWLKLDGSGEVRRVAHHHSSREDGGYFAEQHAVANRDGTKVLFASNWGGTPVSDYLVDLSTPHTQ